MLDIRETSGCNIDRARPSHSCKSGCASARIPSRQPSNCRRFIEIDYRAFAMEVPQTLWEICVRVGGIEKSPLPLERPLEWPLMSRSRDESQVTLLLGAIGQDEQAPARLLAAVYDELRAMARQRLRHERAGHTLQATALVHEAYLKLIGQ